MEDIAGTSEIWSDVPARKKLKKEETINTLKFSDEVIGALLIILTSDEEFSSEESNLSEKDEEECSSNYFSVLAPPPISSTSLFPTGSAADQLKKNQQFFIWNNTSPPCPKIPFIGQLSLKKLPESQTPRGYFDLLFHEELYKLIIEETNKFGILLSLDTVSENLKGSWKNVSEKEFQVWLGLLFHMGHMQLNSLDCYWSMDRLYNLPFYLENMNKDRFFSIMQALHFSENPGQNDPIPADRLYKIRPLLDIFEKTMETVYSPPKQLSINESMIPRKGQKFGIKIYKLVEPSGLVLRLHIYTGAGERDLDRADHTEKLVHAILTDFKYKGHSIFMNNFYNSVNLSTELLKQQTYTTGTLRSNRKENPSDVVLKEIKKGEVVSASTVDGLCVLKWRDRREVLLLSTEFGPELIEVSGKKGVTFKPEAVVEYNNFMESVDRIDKLIPYYSCKQSTLKWYKKVGIHIFQIILLNSFLLYNKFSGNKMSLYQFRHELIASLVPEKSTATQEFSRKTFGWVHPEGEVHFPKENPISEISEKKHKIQKRCRVCQSKGIKKMVTIHCPSCKDNPGLCLECFMLYEHT